MNLATPLRASIWLACITLCVGLAYWPALHATESLPQVSPEGLQLQSIPGVRVFYKRPGATFGKYKRLALLDCYVEFAKGWESNYNDQANFDSQVSASDMDRIKKDLAAEFKRVFTQELQTKGHYKIVDVAAPDVLVLRPAIVNLMVTAPDLMSPDMSVIVVQSAGQMTLYLELWDSVSNTILARVIDPQGDQGFGGMAVTADRVTNQAAADRILKRWADLLRQHLDAVRGNVATP